MPCLRGNCPLHETRSRLTIISHRFRYDQVNNYDFKKQRGRNGAPYSAFVQVVWRKTQRIGVGRAVGKVKGQMFVFYCVRYRPTGYVGTLKNFRRNVQRGKFRKMVAGQYSIGGSAGGFGAMEGI